MSTLQQRYDDDDDDDDDDDADDDDTGLHLLQLLHKTLFIWILSCQLLSNIKSTKSILIGTHASANTE